MSAPQFIVDIPGTVAFGPFTDLAEASWFAEFATAEIDPAKVRELASPVGELLRWRKAKAEWDAG